MNQRINVGLIYGSTRAGRFCDTVASWAAEQIWTSRGFALDLIDPADWHLPGPHEPDDSTSIEALSRHIDRADAFVVVTPEYNHGYPAALRSLIDSVYDEWHAKPVGFVSYGGRSGGLRAVEQLRLVFAELHAVTVRDSVSFARAREQFDASGKLLDPEPVRQAMARMLAQLRWWATALREARTAVPYARMAA